MSLLSAREKALEVAQRLVVMGPVEVKRFFGGAGLALEGIQFAFVMKGALYLRVDDETRPKFEAMDALPFTYAGQSQTVRVASYYTLSDEIIDDPDELLNWVKAAYRAALDAKRATRRRSK
ncbi:TfoX/Sxy family protein [Phyllobacterium sp. OV277]|jgi:TfoX/Sxy family transcriptional regulator of competence genes|uniref:TfoX/Sxy family protein n=1 Tax=Phyllobacterium sp. OV277 TaxID=1882772 RepID=UPI0008925D58|nr:TfoX/Sxy family protein [Phyllobacterium sp. OV277]SDP14454.1 DNA transformation protein [Phyllobacterium sp. OV277]